METWTGFNLYCAVVGSETGSNCGMIFKVPLNLSRSSLLECWLQASILSLPLYLSPGTLPGSQKQQGDFPNDQHGTVHRLGGPEAASKNTVLSEDGASQAQTVSRLEKKASGSEQMALTFAV